MPGQWQQGQAQGGGREPGGGDGVEHPPPGVTERGQEQRRAAEQQGGDVGVQVVERVQDHFAGGGRDRDDAADEGEVPVWQHRPDHLDGDLGGAQRVPDRVSGECEVHPPQRAGQSGGHGDRGEPGRGRGLPPGHHTGLGHRLAERDNQEQPEPFGQVGRLVRDPAHAPPGQERDDQVHAGRERPQRHPRIAVGQPAEGEQRAGDERARGEGVEADAAVAAPHQRVEHQTSCLVAGPEQHTA
jgi:hypothetical protein